MMRTRRMGAALALLAAVSLTACGSAETGEATSPTTAPTASAGAFTADDVAAELRAQLGLAPDDTFQAADPDRWAFYIADVDLPQPHLLRVTMQTDGDDPLIEGSSRAILSLVGATFPDLDYVEVMDASGVHVEQTARQDVPLLNQ